MIRWLCSSLLIAMVTTCAWSQDSVVPLQPRHFNGKRVVKEKQGSLDVFLPAPIVNGSSRTETEVNEALQSKLGNVVRCYASHVADGSTMKIALRFRIHPSGHVDNVKVLTKDVTNGSLLSCLRNLIRQVQFKPADTAVVVEQSFLFRTI